MALQRLLRRLNYFLRRRRLDDELREEMAVHRELAGALAFGNDALAVNQARDVWVAPWLQDISQDVRFGARMLLKDRRFTLAAVCALGLGMGVNLAVFMAIDAAILRHVPFDEPERLVRIQTIDAKGNESRSSWLDVQDWREQVRAFDGIAAETGASMNVSEAGLLAERLRGAYLDWNTFEVLRVRPALGRGFRAEDDRPGAPAVAVISDEVWRTRYGAAADVIGRAVMINDIPATIVGVMPPEFRYPFIAQIWMPLTHASVMAGGRNRRDVRSLGVVARVSHGASVESAAAELQSVAARLASEYPATNAKTRAVVSALKSDIVRNSTPMLITMMSAVAVVLMIACANLAALLLARSVTRTRELAVRAAIGASRWRLVRQLLVECGILATLSGVVGMVLGRYGAAEIVVGFSPIDVGTNPRDVRPYWLDLSTGTSTVLFVVGLCIIVTFACGLIPALHMSKSRVHETLKDGGRGGAGWRARRWTSGLMIAQIAMTLVLLTAAGVLWRQFLRQYFTDPGLSTERLVTGQFMLSAAKYGTPESRQRFFEQVRERIQAAGGVEAVTISSHTPLVGAAGAARAVALEDDPVPLDSAGVTAIAVDHEYFATLRVPILMGRPLGTGDAHEASAGVVVDEHFASTYFRGESRLGHRVQLTTTTPPSRTPWMTIVGVVPAPPTRNRFRVSGARPIVYVPLNIDVVRAAVIVVRSRSSNVDRAVTALRESVRQLEPTLPVYAIQTLEDAWALTRFPSKTLGTWAGTVAAIALIVAAVGLFALTAHAVAQRAHEISVRIALGAEPRAVLWTAARRTVFQLGCGTGLGLAATFAVRPLLPAPGDAITITIVTALLIAIALAATVLPARRAVRIDPAETLRAD